MESCNHQQRIGGSNQESSYAKGQVHQHLHNGYQLKLHHMHDGSDSQHHHQKCSQHHQKGSHNQVQGIGHNFSQLFSMEAPRNAARIAVRTLP